MLNIDCNDVGVQLRVAEASKPLPEDIASGATLDGTEPFFFEVPGTAPTVPMLLMQARRQTFSLFSSFALTFLTKPWH